jgi:hypothetical protein
MKTKKHTILPTAIASICSLAILSLSACGDPDATKADVAADGDAQPTSADLLFMETVPADSRPVAEVIANPKAGEAVTVRGQIGGSLQPFGKDYALFLLTDESVMFCDEMDMHCATPWDACCEDPEKLKKSRALVQFLDEDGEVLPVSLKGFNGLTELDRVVVSGKVAAIDQNGNVIINASGIHRLEG